MDLNKKITFADTVFAQEVDGEMVLLDMNSENYFGLDEVGTAIWQAMGKDKSLQEVLDILLQEYEVESNILEKDLIRFVNQLLDNQLIEVK